MSTPSNDDLALTLLTDATADAARAEGQRTRDARLEAVDRQARSAADDRSGGDAFATVMAVGLTITVLVPFLIGHFLMTKTFVLKPDPGVTDPNVRGISDHFLGTYLAGIVPIALALGVFLVARPPWKYRPVAVIGGAILIVATLVALLPAAQSHWRAAEQGTVAELRETPFPFSSQYMQCAGWTVEGQNGALQSELWQVYLAQRANSGVDGCNRVFVYRGHQYVGMFDLPGDNTFTDSVTINYPGWSTPYHADGSSDMYARSDATGEHIPMNPVATNIELTTKQGPRLNFSLDGAGHGGFDLS